MFVLLSIYTLISVAWFYYIYKTDDCKNWMWLLSWTLFFPVTLILFVVCFVGSCLNGLVDWLKRDF